MHSAALKFNIDAFLIKEQNIEYTFTQIKTIKCKKNYKKERKTEKHEC